MKTEWMIAGALLLALPAQAARFKASDATGTELVACLSEQKDATKRDCLDEIANRRLGQASPQVSALIDSADEDVRVDALATLEKLGAPELLPAAHQVALSDEVVGNRSKALRIIELYGGADSSGVVGQVIAEDSEASIRRKAVVIAGKKGWSDLESVILERGLTDPDPDVNIEAARAVVAFGNPEGRGPIHQLLLESPDPRTREWVVRAIENRPLAVDRDPLIRALDDSAPHVARHAARALRGLGDPSVAPILRDKAMDVRDPAVAEEFSEAAQHLELMGPAAAPAEGGGI